MRRKNVVMLVIGILLCCSQVVYGADNKFVSCKTCKKAIEADMKQFSVVQREVAKPLTFNDIGCALIYREKQCSSRQMVFDSSTRVFDYNDGEELPIDSAYFVKSDVLKSPAGYNYAAFKDENSAEAFLKEKGGEKVFSYEDLQMLEWK